MTPRALDPMATVSFTAHGVTFITRYLTARQQLRIRDALSFATETDDESGYVHAMAEAIAEGVQTWSVTHPDNGPVPFDADALMDTFSIQELGDIFRAKNDAISLSDDDAKKSKPQLPLSGASSAAAATETPDASTPPAPPAAWSSAGAGDGI